MMSGLGHVEESMAFDDVLEELTPADRMRVLALADRKTYADGEIIVEQRVENRSIFFILDGELVIFCSSPTLSDPEAHVEVARLGIGSVVGEMSLLTNAVTSARVVAEGPVTLLTLSHRTLMDLVSTEPALMARFYRSLAVTLAHRLTAANEAAAQNSQAFD